jgi:putative tryptophan/tyrosine transport system substrate-binding protein
VTFSKALSTPLSLHHVLKSVLICLLTLTPTALFAASVVVVLSESSASYQAYALAYRTSIEKLSRNTEIQVLELNQLSEQPIPEAALVIGVGSRAAEKLASMNLQQPLLLAMLPKTTLERLLVLQPKAGGVFIDQPPARYIALVRAALPGTEHIGLLIGREGKENSAKLLAAARELRLRAHAETINAESDIYMAMQRLFANGGVLLATPDSSVFNAQTIPSILLSAYRRGVPVIGFSPAYITAGAMVALYSTPEQLAAQSADISLHVLAGNQIPAPQYPRHYTIGINERVARSLSLTLEGEVVIKERLERLERQP